MTAILSPKVALLDGEPTVYCEGCGMLHQIHVNKPNPHTQAKWSWNGDADKPTFHPSLNYPGKCHSFIREGKIQYLNDCSHDLRGQTVELPDLPEWFTED